MLAMSVRACARAVLSLRVCLAFPLIPIPTTPSLDALVRTACSLAPPLLPSPSLQAFSKNSTDTTATDEASGSAGGDVAGSSAGKKGKALPSIPIPTPRTSMNGMNGINRGINGPIAGSGAPQKTVLEQLEELTKVRACFELHRNRGWRYRCARTEVLW